MAAEPSIAQVVAVAFSAATVVCGTINLLLLYSGLRADVGRTATRTESGSVSGHSKKSDCVYVAPEAPK